MIDERAMRIADDAAAGKLPTRSDIVYLLRFDAYSPEAAYVCVRAREIGMRACGGRGFVYAQIGVDANPCPENCRFCSFAAVNFAAGTFETRDRDEAADACEASGRDGAASAPGAFERDGAASALDTFATFATPDAFGTASSDASSSLEVPIGRIVHYARLFDEGGADLISLMATAGLDFERYLDMVRAVRASISDRPVLMANTADLTIGQARALADAGATAAYHALRLGEGEITDILPASRRRTMRNLRAAGIGLMTGVEPLWEGIDPLELSERICEIGEFGPFAIGACSYTPIAGALMAERRPALTGFVRYAGALCRLACGETVPVGGIGGVAWVDAGCDPRNRGYGADDATLRKKLASARKRLALDGFRIE